MCLHVCDCCVCFYLIPTLIFFCSVIAPGTRIFLEIMIAVILSAVLPLQEEIETSTTLNYWQSKLQKLV